ncbi:unnamed protein product [Camellia sinensis]
MSHLLSLETAGLASGILASFSIHCFCCPKAVCQSCIATTEFARVRRNRGLCNHCLKLALLREENMDVHSDGV